MDFAIDEKGFVTWSEARGWSVKPIVGAVTIWPRSRFGDRSTVYYATEGQGLQYRKIYRGEPDNYSVHYDRNCGRAFYSFDSSPARDN